MYTSFNPTLKMSFESSYSSVFTAYRLFGLVPFKFHFQSITTNPEIFNKKQKNFVSIVEKLWLLCLLLFELQNLVETLHSRIQFLVTCNCINSFNGFRIFMLLTFRVCPILVTLELYFHRNVQMDIIAKLQEIDRIFAQKLKLHMNYHRLKRTIFIAFSKWISICVVFVLILIVSYIIVKAPKEEYTSLAMSLFYPLSKRALYSSTYITYAILIRHRIQAMHEVLDSNLLLLRDSPFDTANALESRNEHDAFELRRMVHLWKIYSLLHETIQLINDSFKWAISFIFFSNVIAVCVGTFQYFDKTYGSPNEYYTNLVNVMCYSFFLVFYYGICFGMMIGMANAVDIDANKIMQKMYQISLSGTISDELQNFVSKSGCHLKRHDNSIEN